MSSTLEQRRSAWWRRASLVTLVALAGISLLSISDADPIEQVEETRQILAAPAPSDAPALAQQEPPSCPIGGVAVARDDVGVGPALRCLPVGGHEVRSSRVDPLYSRIAIELLERIAGRAEGFAGDVRVICWSEEDSKRLVVSFRDAGKIDPQKYWLGWIRRGRGTINLSYLACVQLDRIAYLDARLTLRGVGAAVGTLAHETMHVAGIDDEGVADCYAMQLTAATARGLGAEPGYADLLRVRNFEFNRERRAGTEYDSPDCYDGGPLDLDPESSRWP